MFKATSMILAAAMIVTPLASAGTVKEVTLQMNYDPALLSSEEGAAQVVKSLKREARKLCSHRMPATGSLVIDSECKADLTRAAVQQIQAEQAAAGNPVAGNLAHLAGASVYPLAN